MKIQYFLYLIGIVFVLSFASNIYQYFHKPAPVITTTTKYVTHTDTLTRPVYITIDKIKSTIDTIYVDNKLQLVANADTVIVNKEDTVNVKYYFPPANYFNVRLSLHDRIINHIDSIFVNTNEVVQKSKSFFDNLNYSIFAGPGMDLINKNFGLYLGIGITFNIKSVF